MTVKEQHRAGSVIAGRYQLRDSLGGGGIGQVFRAWDVQGQRAVAVKVFNPSRCGPDAFDRYNKLVAAAGRLGHAGLVLPRGLGLASKNPPLVVMDALAGDDAGKLRARLGRLPWMRALELAAQCAEILHAAVAATKVPHRDLKPANVFVTDRGEVRVLDYGIAEFDIQSGDSTRVDTTLGVVDYKAPEQLEGAATDERTDVFALGVVLYELIGGVLPFRGASYYEVARAILMEPAPTLAEVAPEASVPAGVEALIRRALAKKPEDRFADLKAMADAIAQVRRSPGAVPGAQQTTSGTMIEAKGSARSVDDDDPTALMKTVRGGGRGNMSSQADQPPEDRTVVAASPNTRPGGSGLNAAPRTVAEAGQVGPRTVIGETTGAGPRTVVGETTGAGWEPAPADRTVVHRTVVEGQAPAESTMILPDASAVPSRQDMTMVLPESQVRPQETTMALPDVGVPGPGRGESTLALPDVGVPGPGRGESTMALPDAAEAVAVRRRPRPAGWPLQKTLIVVNVACGVLILIGLLVMLLAG